MTALACVRVIELTQVMAGPFCGQVLADLGADVMIDRFATNAERMARRPELVAELEAALAGDTTEHWVDALLAAGVPAGPIYDYAQAVADPHTEAREL